MTKKKEKTKPKSNVIRDLERRWIKPTIITIIIILLPVLFLGLKWGPSATRAMSEHNAPFSAAIRAARRPDKQSYFENTPNVKTDNIISTEEELPDKPVLIAFYLHHCPYCEVSYPSIKYNLGLLETKYKDMDVPHVHVEVNSPLGVKLRREHNIQVASTMLLLAEHETDNMVIISSTNDASGQPIKDTDSLMKIFKAFDRELDKQYEYKQQRERVN